MESKTSEPKMKLQEIAYQYVQACKLQESQEYALHKAFSALNSDNMIMDLAEPIRRPYRNLIQHLVGVQMMDWIEWWQYETEYGSKSMEFIIDGQAYDSKDMTFYKFWELTYS